MTVEDRLRLHLADKGATWRNEASGTYAAWSGPDGPYAAVLLSQPLTAASIVDAYVGRPAGARLTLVHEGPLSPVALRSAARFGISLLDAASLPALPEPMPAPVAAPVAADAAPLVFEAPALVAELSLPAPEAPPLLPTPEAVPLLPASEPEPLLVAHEPAPLLAAPEPAPLLPAHEEAPLQVAVEGPAEEAVTVEASFDAPAPVETPVALPAQAAAPAEVVVTVSTPAAPPMPLFEGTLPWDPAVPVAEPTPTIHVTADELLALPWHHHAPIEEHVEVMQGSPRARRHVQRPTLAGAPDAAAWGLPWPRPAASTDALSIADPRLWSAQERVHAMRDDLDASRGAASFGAVKPDGSAWLKRIQTF